LSSIDLLQVKKVKEHVFQKILKLDENANSQATSGVGGSAYVSVGGTDSTNSNNPNDSPLNTSSSQKQSVSINSIGNNSSSSVGVNSNDVSSLAGRTIELICSDNVAFF